MFMPRGSFNVQRLIRTDIEAADFDAAGGSELEWTSEDAIFLTPITRHSTPTVILDDVILGLTGTGGGEAFFV